MLSGVLALLEAPENATWSRSQVDLPEAQLEEVLSEKSESQADATKIDEMSKDLE